MAEMNRIRWTFATLIMLSVMGFFWSLSAGAMDVSVWQWLSGELDSAQQIVMERLRLPRAVAAFTVGGMLALAGAIMQVLLRNPLADPYVLGVSGGAAVAALSAILLGAGALVISGSAFTGAMGSMLIVFVIAGRNSWLSSTRLLLTGVVLAAGWGALISLLLVMADDQSLRGMLFWLMGDLGQVNRSGWSIPALLMVFGLLWLYGPDLDLLARGDRQAALLGVAVPRLRFICYLLAALTAAMAVTLAGTIGFVGLVIPHLMRLLVGASHRHLLPCAMLAGGCLLLYADLLSRILLAPRQIPVGVITALLGVPVFLFLLHRKSASEQH